MTNRTRGIRQTFPAGTVLANLGSKPAQPVPVDLKHLVTKGVGSYVAQQIANSTTAVQLGFGFSIAGTPGADEICGFGIWPVQRVFTNGDTLNFVTSEFPAAASAVFDLKTWIAGVRTIVGTITFAASVGTVAWSSSPYTHPADTILELHGPVTPDATLAWITGWVNATAS